MTRRGLTACSALLLAGIAAATPLAFETLPPPHRALLAGAQALWPQLPADERARLVGNARHWTDLDTAGRSRLEAAIRRWDRLPAKERAERRGRFAQWQQLPAEEQAQVRAAAAALAARPLLEQQALRRRFVAQTPSQRDGWQLGPGLGAQMAALRPLFEFQPADVQAALLAMLRGLPPESRATLARVAPALGEARRQALRRELLSAPPAERAALIDRWAKAAG